MHLEFITNIEKNTNFNTEVKEFFQSRKTPDFETWKNFLSEKAHGTFAIIIDTKDYIYAAVDKVRKFPVFYSTKYLKVTSKLKELLKSENGITIDQSQLLLTFFSGYTIGNKTLYNDIVTLEPGQCLILNKSEKNVRVENYFNLTAVKSATLSSRDLKKQFKEILIHTFENIKNLQRPIYVPLSGGMDSRLVVSILKELNCRNVYSFSYGDINNYEVKTAKRVSEKLNVEWSFFPLNKAIQKSSMLSEEFQKYLSNFDTGCSTPFRQDFAVIHHNKKYFHKDGIIINGNTGDFITGGHMPDFFTNPNQLSKEDLLQYICKKHYTLWNNGSDQIKNQIFSEITKEITRLEKNSKKNNFEIYQLFEFFNRQVKFIVNGQRIYDHFDIDWELPFWNDEYLKFWFSVPINFKAKQALYKEFLLEENYGGVWKNFKNVSYKNSFKSIIFKLLLNTLTLIFFINDRETKIKLNRKFVEPLINSYGQYFNYPYFKIFFSKNYPRNVVSWTTYQYLKNKDISISKLINF